MNVVQRPKRAVMRDKAFRTHDFLDKRRATDLILACRAHFSPIYKVGGRIVNGSSVPALTDHLRNVARPSWYNVTNGVAFENHMKIIGFKFADGFMIRNNRNTPTRVVYWEQPDETISAVQSGARTLSRMVP